MKTCGVGVFYSGCLVNLIACLVFAASLSFQTQAQTQAQTQTSTTNNHWHTDSRDIMGTRISLTFWEKSPERAQVITESVFSEVKRLDQLLSP